MFSYVSLSYQSCFLPIIWQNWISIIHCYTFSCLYFSCLEELFCQLILSDQPIRHCYYRGFRIYYHFCYHCRFSILSFTQRNSILNHTRFTYTYPKYILLVWPHFSWSFTFGNISCFLCLIGWRIGHGLYLSRLVFGIDIRCQVFIFVQCDQSATDMGRFGLIYHGLWF